MGVWWGVVGVWLGVVLKLPSKFQRVSHHQEAVLGSPQNATTFRDPTADIQDGKAGPPTQSDKGLWEGLGSTIISQIVLSLGIILRTPTFRDLLLFWCLKLARDEDLERNPCDFLQREDGLRLGAVELALLDVPGGGAGELGKGAGENMFCLTLRQTNSSLIERDAFFEQKGGGEGTLGGPYTFAFLHPKCPGQKSSSCRAPSCRQ